MNPVNGPVLAVLLLTIVTLAALWRAEAASARAWRDRAERLDEPIDLWPVSNVRVTDDWPPAVREHVESKPIRVVPDYPVSTVRAADVVRTPRSSTFRADEAAARRRHPAGRGLRAIGGEGA